MERVLANGALPPETSATLYRAMIDASEKIIKNKLQFVQMVFQSKFNELIFNYLGSNGKVVKWFGLFG